MSIDINFAFQIVTSISVNFINELYTITYNMQLVETFPTYPVLYLVKNYKLALVLVPASLSLYCLLLAHLMEFSLLKQVRHKLPLTL